MYHTTKLYTWKWLNAKLYVCMFYHKKSHTMSILGAKSRKISIFLGVKPCVLIMVHRALQSAFPTLTPLHTHLHTCIHNTHSYVHTTLTPFQPQLLPPSRPPLPSLDHSAFSPFSLPSAWATPPRTCLTTPTCLSLSFSSHFLHSFLLSSKISSLSIASFVLFFYTSYPSHHP